MADDTYYQIFLSTGAVLDARMAKRVEEKPDKLEVYNARDEKVAEFSLQYVVGWCKVNPSNLVNPGKGIQ